MISKFISVDRGVLGEIIVLVDEGEKLSEKLEDHNQELRILLHRLVRGSKGRKQLKDRESFLRLTGKHKGRE